MKLIDLLEAEEQQQPQQEIAVDVNRINKVIHQLEVAKYFTPEVADEMRNAVSTLVSGRQLSDPNAILQLLTVVS